MNQIPNNIMSRRISSSSSKQIPLTTPAIIRTSVVVVFGSAVALGVGGKDVLTEGEHVVYTLINFQDARKETSVIPQDAKRKPVMGNC